jgi:hypothetical protein
VILRTPLLQSIAKGVGANFSAGGCLGPCFLQLEVGAGLYFSKPEAGDNYFHDVHFDVTLGGAFLGITPQSGVDWLSPDLGMSQQLGFGLGAGAGISAFAYGSKAVTKEAHEGFAREVTGGAWVLNGSVSRNSAGQQTVGGGGSLSVGAGAAVYNAYTWTTPGLLQTVRGD